LHLELSIQREVFSLQAHTLAVLAFVLLQIERIARVAFEAARKRNKRLCSVEKSNVLEVSQLWKEVVTKVRDQGCDRGCDQGACLALRGIQAAQCRSSGMAVWPEGNTVPAEEIMDNWSRSRLQIKVQASGLLI